MSKSDDQTVEEILEAEEEKGIEWPEDRLQAWLEFLRRATKEKQEGEEQ